MKNLFKKLAAFQQECPIIHKDTQGYGYSYADLPKIFSVINPLLKKHGLGFYQALQPEGLQTTIFCIESGEQIVSITPIPICTLKGMNDYQSFGSGVTYYRRYALSAILGIVTDKDTDAAGQQIDKLEEFKLITESCSNIEELNAAYNKHKVFVEKNPKIKELFTNRKTQF